MKDSSVFYLKKFFFFLVSRKIIKQSVYSYICFTIAIINLEIITKTFWGPSNLFEIKVFCIYKLFKVVVVSKNEDYIVATY